MREGGSIFHIGFGVSPITESINENGTSIAYVVLVKVFNNDFNGVLVSVYIH